MSTRLVCPCCQSHQIERTNFSFWNGAISAREVVQWHCTSCGETCDDPAHAPVAAPRVNIAMGVAVLTVVLLTAVQMLAM
jgi:ribosomal protein L37AE/L43A